MLRVRLSELGNQAATQAMVSCLSHVVRADSSLYVEIRYDQPSKYDQNLDYSTVEEIYEILVNRGLYGRVLTRHQSGVDVKKPEIIVARRDHPVAETSVPSGVVKLAEKFLVGCVKRDKRMMELFSSRVRGASSEEELRAFVLGTSNPHHHGYFIHSVAPHERGWSVVVSLYDHCTDHNLDLDPEKNQYSFMVVREEDKYVVDSLPYVEAEAIQLVEDDTIYFMRVVRYHTWSNSYLPLQCVFTVHAGGQLLHRLQNYWLTIERVEDITGDDSKEVVLRGGTGGNCYCCSMLAILQLTDVGVTQLWPDEGLRCPHDDCGCAGVQKDLDRDGIAEIVTMDTRFVYWGPLVSACHACQPTVPIVHKWDNGCYRYASREFPEVYQDIIERIRSIEPESVRSVDPHNRYEGTILGFFSQLVELMGCYDHMGLKEEGWKELQRLVQEWDFERIWNAYAQMQDESPLSIHLDTFRTMFFESAGFRVP